MLTPSLVAMGLDLLLENSDQLLRHAPDRRTALSLDHDADQGLGARITHQYAALPSQAAFAFVTPPPRLGQAVQGDFRAHGNVAQQLRIHLEPPAMELQALAGAHEN